MHGNSLNNLEWDCGYGKFQLNSVNYSSPLLPLAHAKSLTGTNPPHCFGAMLSVCLRIRTQKGPQNGAFRFSCWFPCTTKKDKPPMSQRDAQFVRLQFSRETPKKRPPPPPKENIVSRQSIVIHSLARCARNKYTVRMKALPCAFFSADCWLRLFGLHVHRFSSRELTTQPMEVFIPLHV